MNRALHLVFQSAVQTAGQQAWPFDSTDLFAVLPALVMVLFACGTMLLDVVGRGRAVSSRAHVWFGLAGLGVTALAFFRQWRLLSRIGFAGMVAAQGAIILDGAGLLTNGIVLGATALFYLFSYRFLEIHDENRAEYYALALLAETGMYFMSTASELVTLFLGIELTSICFYILVGFTRADRRSNEAAVKYFLLGAVSSGFLLYGFSLLYGMAGSTALPAIAASAKQLGSGNSIVILAVVTVMIGLLFKVSAVPFHTWTPDAYEGAATPVTAYLSVASKAASFMVLIRLLVFTLPAARNLWDPLLTIAAVASMSLGTIAALTQTRLKRLLAYSSIAHAGYILLGIAAGNETGLEGVYIYLIVYAAANLGVFAVLISMNRRGMHGEMLDDLRGLSKNHPIYAAVFVILLLSLAGIPPTAGFIGKYYVFLALIQAGRFGLAAVASTYVVVSLYFYFRLVRAMYMEEPARHEPLSSSLGTSVALAVTTAATVLLGLFPEQLLRLGAQLIGTPR